MNAWIGQGGAGGSSGSWGGHAALAFGPSISAHWLLAGGLIWLGVLVILAFAGWQWAKTGIGTTEAPPVPKRPALRVVPDNEED